MSEYYPAELLRQYAGHQSRSTSRPAARPGFMVRGTLAATLSSVWGIYNGFELCEAPPMPGKEEYLEFREIRDQGLGLRPPRQHPRAYPALNQHPPRRTRRCWDFRNIIFLNAWNDQILSYARMTPRRGQCVLVARQSRPAQPRRNAPTRCRCGSSALPDHGAIDGEDLLNGGALHAARQMHRIALDPASSPVVIWRLIPPGRD